MNFRKEFSLWNNKDNSFTIPLKSCTQNWKTCKLSVIRWVKMLNILKVSSKEWISTSSKSKLKIWKLKKRIKHWKKISKVKNSKKLTFKTWEDNNKTENFNDNWNNHWKRSKNSKMMPSAQDLKLLQKKINLTAIKWNSVISDRWLMSLRITGTKLRRIESRVLRKRKLMETQLWNLQKRKSNQLQLSRLT